MRKRYPTWGPPELEEIVYGDYQAAADIARKLTIDANYTPDAKAFWNIGGLLILLFEIIMGVWLMLYSLIIA